MDYKIFYDERKGEVGFDAFYDILTTTFTGDPKEYTDLAAIKALYRGKREGISKSQFYLRKKYIVSFYEWLFENGVVNENIVKSVSDMGYSDILPDHDLHKEYFSSLDEVIKFITRVGRSKGLGDFDDLLNVKTMAILSWYGVEIEDMAKIKKSDISLRLGCVNVNGAPVYIEGRFLEIMHRFAYTDTHRGFPSRKTQHYRNSIYLMRSAMQEIMGENSLVKIFLRFNAEAESKGKKLTVSNLRKNGVVRRVFDEHKATGADEMVLIQRFLGCDSAFATNFKSFYNAWKDVIVGGGES